MREIEAQIISLRRLGEVLQHSIGKDYYYVSKILGPNEFNEWMRTQEDHTGIPDAVATICFRNYKRYLLSEKRKERGNFEWVNARANGDHKG